jgi:acyl-CoA synthetase (AMP-forming)/AMP-acid ligase II/enoyl-CoA hydratase/carnithine racemase
MVSAQSVVDASRVQVESIWETLAARAAITPSAEFAVDETRRSFSFDAFRRLAEGIAATLYTKGIRAGDVVSWQLPNTVETMALAMALSRLGAVQNPLVTMLRDPEIAFISEQVGSRLLIVPRMFRGYDYADMAARVAAGSARGLQVLVVDGEWELGDPAVLPPPAHPADPDDVSWIFYTSGTTAVPKGVKHTDGGLLAAAATFVTNVRARPEDRCAALAPVAHIGGIAHLLHAVIVGHALIVSATFVPEETANLLIEQNVTLVGSGLPFTNEYLRLSRERGAVPLFPHARATLAGGSPRPRAQHAAAKTALGGVGVISGYGMTECPYITWGTPDDTDEQHAVFEGFPAGGGAVRIVRTDETDAATGEIGEIRVRGPQLFKGYVDSALDEGTLDRNGFFRTGDLGYVDADGCLAVTGRIKDVIVRKMENISAREVEEAVIGHPAVADVAVIGVPDSNSGERVCAVVVPANPGRPPALEDLREFLHEVGLNIRKFPEQVEVLDVLPRNAMGKIVKPELRKRFASEDSSQPTPSGHTRVEPIVTETVFDTIEFEIADHIATITLNRPDQLNCFNEAMTREMAAVWARVRDDDDIHVAVVRAKGERAFCTGVDVSAPPWWTHLNQWNQEDPGVLLGPRQHKVWKPVVCAVNGMAAGGAMYFVNESDIVICSEDATFFDPHANGGRVSALEPIGMLARGIPFGEVMRWALLGSDERITAHTALRAGIVTEVTEPGQLWDRAHELATEIAGRRPEAIQGTVRAIWESLDMMPSMALRNGLSYTQIGNNGRDDVDSRTNKRKPRFR